MTLTSLGLSDQLNQLKLSKGVFFLPAVKDHLNRMTISNEEVLVHTDHKEIIMEQIDYGPTVTAFFGLDPVAMFGFVPIWEGVAESWLVADNGVRTRPLTLTKYGIAAHDIAKISMGLHRLQITVRITDNRAMKWAFALGFENEVIMKKYGPDQVDYYLMARF
jgi:hypothetical protein